MPGRATLWFAFLGGPLAWTAHLLASYPLVSHACAQGSTALLNGITAATLLVSLGAAAAGWWAARRVPAEMVGEAGARSNPAGGVPGEAEPTAGVWGEAPRRARFMALCGLWLGVLFAFVILVEGLPPLLQDPCLGIG